MFWYYSLNEYLNKTFGQKVYKISINSGLSCPNRDGRISYGGCIFCSEGGSGDFAESSELSITDQIEAGKKRLSSKFSDKNGKYIAYFQAYTNTYGDINYLKDIFTEAINHPDIVALSIATRPDCLPTDILTLLDELNKIKPIWIELGLQTIHENTASYINRGYDFACFKQAVNNLRKLDIDVIVHIILGLPGETNSDMLQTIKCLSDMDIQGIKLQLLHVLKNTRLADDYINKKFKVMTMDNYINLLCDCIKLLPPDIVIHRLTGDGPKNLLIAPLWSADKKHVLNTINHTFKEKNIIQGQNYVRD
ncbi:MAG: TIGR01212 family radical SAM protein [Eubacterium sp.]